MTKPTPIVYVVDDEPDVRTAVSMLLRSVGIAASVHDSAQAFLDAFDTHRPGCLVLDVRMPGMSGLELQQRLNDLGARLPIIIVTGHGDVPMAVNAMKAGAWDFLEKPFNDQALLDRVHKALDESGDRLRSQQTEHEAQARYAHLTPRERQVLAGILDGKLNKVMAYDLGISTRTVEIHRANLMEKMGVRNLSDLFKMAAVLEQALTRDGVRETG